jgi:site-specific recombinase XerD
LGDWSDLQRSQLEAWLQARQQAGIAASSRTTELSDLLSCLRFAAERGVSLSANLFRVAYPQRTDALPRYLTELEYRRLEQVVLTQTAADTHAATCDRAWFFTLAHTGLRVSELLNLRLADLQLASGRLIVRGGKNTRDRVVYLTPTLTQALRTYLSHRQAGDDDHLWLDAGRPLKDHQVRYRLRRWGQSCDLTATPHRLRHTLATRLINQGMSLESLCKLLGHRDLRMTQHYARVYDATVREQFQTAMAYIEGVVITNWPQPETIVADPLAGHALSLERNTTQRGV